MGILSDFMKPVSLAAFALLVVAAPATSETGTGDLSGAGSGQERNPAGAALEGSDAYAALLDLYIREHPDAARHPEFLPFFANLGCKAEGWGRKRDLNPFEVAEIESAAQSRLDRKMAEASASPANEPVLITFQANITAGDYDMAEGVFPITAGRSMRAVIRPDDYCVSLRSANFAKAKGLRHRTVFPDHFQIATADWVILKPSHLVEMLGGQVAMGAEQVSAFYEHGFPTMVVEVTGRVRSVTRAKAGVGFVTIEPVRATLRPQVSKEKLAVLGPEQLGSFATDADFNRDVYLIGSADQPPPQGGAIVKYSTANLDASEAKALTGAITYAIGVEPHFMEVRGEGIYLTDSAIGHSSYALVAGDWRNKLTHAIESRFPNADLNVIQIARGAGAAKADETSEPP